MTEPPERLVTLAMVYDAIVTLINEVQQSRAQWQEAEANLLAQASFHRERLDEQQRALEEVRYELHSETEKRDRELVSLRQKFYELKDNFQPLHVKVEEIEKRLDLLEGRRRDTEQSPPPATEPPTRPEIPPPAGENQGG